MHRISTPIGLVLLLAVALVPAWPAALGAQDTGPAGVDVAWVRGMKANDVDGIVKCYAPDAVAWLPGSPAARGESAIRATYTGLLSGSTVKDVALSDVQEKRTGDLAIRWGTFSLTLEPKAGGNPAVVKGRFSEVLELRNGQWVYTVDHASEEPAAK